MQDLNRVSLVGRLTKNVDVKTFPNGGSILNLSLASNYSTKKNGEWVDETSFFEIRYSTKSTAIAGFLLKGTQIAADGTLKQERWEKGGQKYSKIVIWADSIQLLGGKNQKQGSSIPGNVQALANAVDGEAFPEDIPF